MASAVAEPGLAFMVARAKVGLASAFRCRTTELLQDQACLQYLKGRGATLGLGTKTMLQRHVPWGQHRVLGGRGAGALQQQAVGWGWGLGRGVSGTACRVGSGAGARSQRIVAGHARGKKAHPNSIKPARLLAFLPFVLSGILAFHLFNPADGLLVPLFSSPISYPGYRLTSIPLLDPLLGFVTPFFSETAAFPPGLAILVWLQTINASWAVAGGIESSRRFSNRGLLKWFTPIMMAALALGTGFVLPLVWTTAYLSTHAGSLTEQRAKSLGVGIKQVLAIICSVAIGLVPFTVPLVAGPQVRKLQVAVAAMLAVPLLWQAVWAAFRSSEKDDFREGHQAAVIAHLLTAGTCAASHVVLAALLFSIPSIGGNLVGLFSSHGGSLVYPYVMLLNVLVAWASYVSIPFAIEGTKVGIMVVVASMLLSPGAAMSFYFAYREAQVLVMAYHN